MNRKRAHLFHALDEHADLAEILGILPPLGEDNFALQKKLPAMAQTRATRLAVGLRQLAAALHEEK